MVSRICKVIRNRVTDECTEDEVHREAQALIVQEIVDELVSRRATIGTTTFSLALNVIPLGGGAVVGAAKDIKSLISESRSWISVLGK